MKTLRTARLGLLAFIITASTLFAPNPANAQMDLYSADDFASFSFDLYDFDGLYNDPGDGKQKDSIGDAKDFGFGDLQVDWDFSDLQDWGLRWFSIEVSGRDAYICAYSNRSTGPAKLNPRNNWACITGWSGFKRRHWEYRVASNQVLSVFVKSSHGQKDEYLTRYLFEGGGPLGYCFGKHGYAGLTVHTEHSYRCKKIGNAG